jgi:developmentally-regulated GTP-binding protein 1
LKRELLEPSGGGGGGGGTGFEVRRSGDRRVGLVGFPSVGKSTLLTKLTGTFSESAEYAFTTLTAVPGVVYYRGGKFQILDLPGIIEGAKDGKGRGRQVIAAARTCDLICITLDAMNNLNHKYKIEHELEGFGIRLNKQPPNIAFTQKEKGGVTVTSTVPLTKISHEEVKAICREYRTPCADVVFREDATADQLIDIIEGNRVYIPAIYILNKIDQITMEELDIFDRLPHYVPISAHKEWNFDALLEAMWDYLDLIRIYTKPKGQIPDYTAPIVLKRGSTVEDFCFRIHRTLADRLKYALVWGSSVKHNPQKCGRGHVLQDEDVVQLVKNN